MMVLILFRCHFLSNPHSHFNSLHKARPLMVPAELANWIDYSVHLPEWHAIHLTVQFFEVRLYLLVVVGIVFVEAFI